MVVNHDMNRENGRVLSPEALTPAPVLPVNARSAPASRPSVERREVGASEPASRGLYLIGRPTLKQYLQHVRRNAVDPPRERDLIDEWNAARRVVKARERDEAGLADQPPIVALGPEYQALLVELLRDPLIRHGFNSVPTEVALVDLDRMVVYQKHIDLDHVARLDRELAPEPSREQVFRMCLPHDHPVPAVRWSRTPGGKFVFVSPSNDLRYLGVMSLDPGDIPNTPPPGTLVGVVGIAVGFGSNFLNAIYAEQRLVLRNGSHRAYLLRQRGITHVPCIVQHVSSRDELEVVASSDLEHHPDRYLRDPRPPMLRDYFDPALHKVMALERRTHQVTVSFETDETDVPAL